MLALHFGLQLDGLVTPCSSAAVVSFVLSLTGNDFPIKQHMERGPFQVLYFLRFRLTSLLS